MVSGTIQRLAIITFSVLACSCASDATIPSSEFLGDYTALKVPLRDIPIGARWEPGVGPDGPGLDSKLLRTLNSVDTLSSNSTFKLKVDAGFYQLLGLSADVQRASTLDFADIEIVTVANTADLNPDPGTQILYEGIRIGTFKIKTDATYQGSVSASLAKQAGVIKLSNDNSDSSTFTVEGSNLFVGYRVISFGKAQINSPLTVSFRGVAVQLGPYKVSVASGALERCLCERPHMSAGDQNACYANNSIKLRAENPAAGKVGTGGLIKSFDYRLRSPLQGSVLLDSRKRSGVIETDRFSMQGSSSFGRACALAGDMAHSAVTFDAAFTNDTTMTLEQVQYPFATAHNPEMHSGPW